jgi:hypothetical protein
MIKSVLRLSASILKLFEKGCCVAVIPTNGRNPLLE